MVFITDYTRLEHELIRKPYPLLRTGETIQQLEGFQYVTILDLNTGYYNIRLLPPNQDMITIVTKSGKLRYNCLPMGMCASGYIYYKSKWISYSVILRASQRILMIYSSWARSFLK